MREPRYAIKVKLFHPQPSPRQIPDLCKSLYMYIALGGYGPRRGVPLSCDNSIDIMLIKDVGHWKSYTLCSY